MDGGNGNARNYLDRSGTTAVFPATLNKRRTSIFHFTRKRDEQEGV